MKVNFKNLPDSGIITEVETLLKQKIGSKYKINKDGNSLVFEPKKKDENLSTQNIKNWIKKGLFKSGVGKNSKIISINPNQFTIFYKEE